MTGVEPWTYDLNKLPRDADVAGDNTLKVTDLLYLLIAKALWKNTIMERRDATSALEKHTFSGWK